MNAKSEIGLKLSISETSDCFMAKARWRNRNITDFIFYSLKFRDRFVLIIVMLVSWKRLTLIAYLKNRHILPNVALIFQ